MERFNQDWLLDSGCTYHMTHDEHWLSDYKEINGGKVIMGDSHTCEFRGAVSIKLFDSIKRKMSNVRYVPNLGGIRWSGLYK